MTRTPTKLKIEDSGPFNRIPIGLIEIVDRPESDSITERLFYNPRSLESFTLEEMEGLMKSIQEDGLLQPPVVHVVTEDGKNNGNVVKVELIAGERRLRSILKLIEQNAMCHCNQSKKMLPAKELYGQLPCKVICNTDDEVALRIAFIENFKHKSLSVKEEIDIVERLAKRGKSQEEIKEALDANITWVSQTSNFRDELPPEAFSRLLDGKISRNVAVQILSFKKEDRHTAFSNALEYEKEIRTKALNELEETQILAEDTEIMAEKAAARATQEHDYAEVAIQERRKKTASKNATAAKLRKDRVVSEAGVIRQSHLIKGAVIGKVTPKKAKMLTSAIVMDSYVQVARNWLEEGHTDSVTGELVPNDALEILIATAKGILNGQTDIEKLIRTLMIKRGEWQGTEEIMENILVDEDVLT